MPGAGIVLSSGQAGSGSSLTFEREFLLEDLRDAGSAILDGGPLAGWDEVVSYRDKHDVVEALWPSTAPTGAQRLGCGLWTSIWKGVRVPALAFEHAADLFEFLPDGLLVDLLPRRLALGDVSIVL
jgi:hypothetical protein